MGCIASKSTLAITPDDVDTAFRDHAGGFNFSHRSGSSKYSDADKRSSVCATATDDSVRTGRLASGGNSSTSLRVSYRNRYIQGEHVAAGWPAWLSAVAGEAIQGWVPLRAESFEKLEKIGQGTYSSVFRARDLDTGKIVALKKVRFDNFEPESVRFMAREIQILRRLDHPNVIKLEGLITSQISSSIYLVFEYMEHDLSGLSSSPDIKFTESQVKCYMHQLLSGLQHCHSRGVMHRDIKGSNLLINNQGILKIADFGLANYACPDNRQPLTSRVVTLWYRPPELLLGSTDYDASVDLWSVGCVFAELLLGKPILQGRTEVEQIHKIFKLCGSPPEEYWKKSKLAHATIFRPQHFYESTLHDVCKGLTSNSFSLIETLLSVEPYIRGTATTALTSEYFTTKPYACDPSSLPKYPPNKEIDAKNREEIRRRKECSRGHGFNGIGRASRGTKPLKEANGLSRLASHAEGPRHGIENRSMTLDMKNCSRSRLFVDLQPKPEIVIQDKVPVCDNCPGQMPFSGPLLVSSSNGFTSAQTIRDDTESMMSFGSCRSNASSILGRTSISNVDSRHSTGQEGKARKDNGGKDSQQEVAMRAMMRQYKKRQHPNSFNAPNICHPHDFPHMHRGDSGYQDSVINKVEYSGPLLSQTHKVDELLDKHERQIRQAMRHKSWFHRMRKQGR